MRRTSILGFSFCSLLALACADVDQELGAKPNAGAGGNSGSVGAGGSAGGGIVEPPAPASGFQWLNPKPHGNAFRAIAATSDANVWLGGRAEVLSWNGQTWTTHAPAAGDVLYHALWVRHANDVWAGGTRLSWTGDEEAVLAHFDGAKWTSSGELAGRRVAALAGTGKRGYLALDGGEIRVSDGGAWKLEATFPGREIRAIFAFGDDDAWAVGDAGFVARRSAGGWSVAGAALAGSGAPFGNDRHYLGVWASSPSDAWATFETAPLDGTTIYDSSLSGDIGFARWNGSTWSVIQMAPADCVASVDGGPAGGSAGPAFRTRGAVETRRGALLAGRSATDIVASVGNGRCLWHYDGTSFSPIIPRYYPIGKVWWVNLPLGAAPVVAATPSSTLIAGSGGQLMSFDPAERYTVPAEPPTPSSTVGSSPALKHVFTADRETLYDIAMDGDTVVGSFGGRPSTWSVDGWTPLLGPAGSLDPTSLVMPPPPSGGFDLVHVDGGGALWAITRSAGSPPIVATRWDGVSWTNVDVGETGDLNGIDDGYPRAVWSAPGGGTVWFSSTARLRRFDGEKFVSVDLPSPPGFQVANVGGITGTGENDVWIATAAIRLPISFPGEWRFVLFHYDGQSVSLVHDRPVSGEPSSAPLVHLLGPEKVWVVETTRPPGIQSGFVWDGASASELTLPPFTIDDLWARAPNDVYLLGRMNARGSYLFHYDGQGFTPIFAADRLETQTLTGNATSLWLGGENGATVRAALPAAVY